LKSKELTHEHIAECLKEKANDLFQNLAGFSVVLFLFFLIGSLALVHVYSNNLFWLLLLIPSGLFAYAVFYLKQKKKMIENRQYSVVKDILIRKYNTLVGWRALLPRPKYKKDYYSTFEFSYFGLHPVFSGQEMSTFELSDCGDTFYIVVYNNRKERAVAFFNAKLYD